MQQFRFNRFLTLTAIAAGLFTFGVGYAYRIAVKPFPPHRTWLSVVVGDTATDVGMSLILYVQTGDWRLAAVPWFSHALTGLPMILGQVVKHQIMDLDAQAVEAGNDKATALAG